MTFVFNRLVNKKVIILVLINSLDIDLLHYHLITIVFFILQLLTMYLSIIFNIEFIQ